ncbi:unnamed protein product [Protopolystoma xenopodis]|uniref:Uncharacterized protein n=1 Tax=Protopolystoma xenopodis TaxID=117903 RepID=A0A3S5ADE1_9PLAT|nr:unnamed protein product [Protopolystoma xenopodis]
MNECSYAIRPQTDCSVVAFSDSNSLSPHGPGGASIGPPPPSPGGSRRAPLPPSLGPIKPTNIQSSSGPIPSRPAPSIPGRFPPAPLQLPQTAPPSMASPLIPQYVIIHLDRLKNLLFFSRYYFYFSLFYFFSTS